jgi:hypothetical protein
VEQARRRRDVLAPRVRGVGASSLLASAASAVNARVSDQARRRRGERRCVFAPRFRGGSEGKAGGIGGGFLLCVITFREPRRLRGRIPLCFFYVRNPGLLFIFFHTLPPPYLYVIFIFIRTLPPPTTMGMVIFIRTLPPPTTMGMVSQETADGSTKCLSHQKKCPSFILFSCRRFKKTLAC